MKGLPKMLSFCLAAMCMAVTTSCLNKDPRAAEKQLEQETKNNGTLQSEYAHKIDSLEEYNKYLSEQLAKLQFNNDAEASVKDFEKLLSTSRFRESQKASRRLVDEISYLHLNETNALHYTKSLEKHKELEEALQGYLSKLMSSKGVD